MGYLRNPTVAQEVTNPPDNTVLFFQWVIVENTLVMIAASVPLLRPLFNIAVSTVKTGYGSNSNTHFELSSKQNNGSRAFAYGQNSHTTKSMAGASSSEENILPIQKGVPLTVKERVLHFGKGENVDVEKGVIKKEVQYQVQYETDTSAEGAGTSPKSTEWNQNKKGGNPQ